MILPLDSLPLSDIFRVKNRVKLVDDYTLQQLHCTRLTQCLSHEEMNKMPHMEEIQLLVSIVVIIGMTNSQ